MCPPDSPQVRVHRRHVTRGFLALVSRVPSAGQASLEMLPVLVASEQRPLVSSAGTGSAGGGEARGSSLGGTGL